MFKKTLDNKVIIVKQQRSNLYSLLRKYIQEAPQVWYKVFS